METMMFALDNEICWRNDIGY